MNLRRFLNVLLRPLGCELAKLSQKPDPFHQQRRILGRQPVRTIMDLGANVGQTAARFRKTFSSATIYCFEPFPDSYDALCRTHARDPGVRPQQLAASDSVGEQTFFVGRDSQVNSLLPIASDGDLHMGGTQAELLGEIRVQTTTLDGFCRDEGIDHVDVLKMDIQGGELAALRGARGLLERQAVDIIYSEVLFAQLYDGGAAFDELWHYLRQFGYELYGLYDLTPGQNDFLGFGDAIFTAPRFVQEAISRARAA